MIEYFMENTKGKIPISFTDVQSPLNMITYVLPINDLFLDIYDNADDVRQVADIFSSLLVNFFKKQEAIIGDALVKPGHGFASSRVFEGVGYSNDTSLMISDDDYMSVFKNADTILSNGLNGLAYHSCGNWHNKINMVKQLENLKAVDGAFSIETDPDPNNPLDFKDKFSNTNVVLNARVVGDVEEVFSIFEKLYSKSQKLIIVTYLKTSEEQQRLYDLIHSFEIETI